MTGPPRLQAIGIFWVRAGDYARYLELCEDRHSLHATYEKWFYAANKGFEQLKRRRDIEVMKVTVDLDAFAAWCRAKGLNINGDARTEYANEIVAAQIRSRDHNKH